MVCGEDIGRRAFSASDGVGERERGDEGLRRHDRAISVTKRLAFGTGRMPVFGPLRVHRPFSESMRACFRRRWHNARSELRTRREHAMEARERIARRRDEGAKTRNAFDGRHHAAARRVPRRLFDAIRDAAVRQHAKARQRKGRPKPIATKALSAHVIARGDGDGCVQVKTIAEHGGVVARRQRFRAVWIGRRLARVVRERLHRASIGAEERELLRERRLRRFV